MCVCVCKSDTAVQKKKKKKKGLCAIHILKIKKWVPKVHLVVVYATSAIANLGGHNGRQNG